MKKDFDYKKLWENFDNLTVAQLSVAEKGIYETLYKPGEIIFKQGSPEYAVAFVLEGISKIYIETPERNIIVSIILPCSPVIDPALFSIRRC